MPENIIMNITDIQKYIRDIYPYLYVDAVTELCEGKYIRSIKNVSYNEWYFPCHFPGNPVVPGVIQLESIFQSAAILVAMLPGNKEKTVYIQKIDNTVFLKEVRPGMIMHIEAAVTRGFRRGVGEFYGNITIDGETVCKTDFRMVISEDIISRNT